MDSPRSYRDPQTGEQVCDENILKIGAGVNPHRIEFSRSGLENMSLVLRFAETGESITLLHFFMDSWKSIQKMEFADGTIWTDKDLEVYASDPMMERKCAKPHAGSEGETFTGTEGNDSITGGVHDDRIIGGKGDDCLSGGRGGDTYVWNPGDGNDRITDYLYHYGDINTLVLGHGITEKDIIVCASGEDIVLFVSKTGESITLTDWFKDTRNKCIQVKFEDGTLWHPGKISSLLTGQVLYGTDEQDTLIGKEGLLDILYGGKGNDILRGGNGVDYYVWNVGDGNDTIVESSNTSKETNVLTLGIGIEPDDILVTRSKWDILLTHQTSAETITLKGWYWGKNYQVTQVTFTDRTVWSPGKISKMAGYIRGTDEGETIQGTNGDDFIIGGKGDDHLIGLGGHDTYIWNLGDGNDTISDNGTNNVLKMGKGIEPEDLTLSHNGKDLVLHVRQTGEKITLTFWNTSGDMPLSHIEFASGRVMTYSDINARITESALTSFSSLGLEHNLSAAFAGMESDKTSVLDTLTRSSLDAQSESLAVASLNMLPATGEMIVSELSPETLSLRFEITGTNDLGGDTMHPLEKPHGQSMRSAV